jgi:hypothetical protein
VSDDRVGGSTRRDRIVLTILGLVIAPVVGGVVVALGAVSHFLIAQAGAGRLDASAIQQAITGAPQFMAVAAMAGAVFGILPALLLGWPAHLLLNRRQWTSARTYALAGAPLGFFIVRLAYVFMGGGTAFLLPLPSDLLFALLGGAAGAFTFWLIRRPDRDPTLTQRANTTTQAP